MFFVWVCLIYFYVHLFASRFVRQPNKKCIKNVWVGGHTQDSQQTANISVYLSVQVLKRSPFTFAFCFFCSGGKKGNMSCILVFLLGRWHCYCCCVVVLFRGQEVAAATSQWKICHANSQMSNIQLLFRCTYTYKYNLLLLFLLLLLLLSLLFLALSCPVYVYVYVYVYRCGCGNACNCGRVTRPQLQVAFINCHN